MTEIPLTYNKLKEFLISHKDIYSLDFEKWHYLHMTGQNKQQFSQPTGQRQTESSITISM